MNDHRPPFGIDHETQNRASDAHYESKRRLSGLRYALHAAFMFTLGVALAAIFWKGLLNVLHILAGVGV